MKAKEYASRVMAAPNFVHALVEALDALAQEAVDSGAKCKTAASVLACVRNAFTKWKAVVHEISLAGGTLPVESAHALFPKYFAQVSPQLFSVALKSKVFLGYTPDMADSLLAEQGRLLLEREMLQDQVNAMRKGFWRANGSGRGVSWVPANAA